MIKSKRKAKPPAKGRIPQTTFVAIAKRAMRKAQRNAARENARYGLPLIVQRGGDHFVPHPLPPEHDQHTIVLQLGVGGHVNHTIGDGVDADDVGLADMIKEIGNFFIEPVLADLLAVRPLDGLDPHPLVGFLGRHLQRLIGLLDEGFGGSGVIGHTEVLLDRGRRGGRSLGDRGRRGFRPGAGDGDGDETTGALEGGPGTRCIHFQFLVAIGAFEVDVHS